MDVIIAEHSRQIVECLIVTHEASINAQSDGLTSFLTCWIDEDVNFDAAWDIAFGSIHALILNRIVLPAEVVASALALQLNWNGFNSEWETKFASPARLRLGHFLLPPAERIKVQADDTQIRISTIYENVTTTNLFDRRMGTSTENGIISLPVIRSRNGACTVLCPGAVSTTDMWDLYDKIDWAGVSSFAKNCLAAIEFLEDFTKPYGEWVGKVIRYLVPLKMVENDRFDSGSRYFLPGLIYLTNLRDPIQIAETMVHEASHQYFNILKRLEALHDPEDSKLYFSAIKGKERPLIYILLAYHAFANVCLFLRSAREHGFRGSEDLDAYEFRLSNQVHDLETQLRSADSLTPCGVELWQDLSQALAKTRVIIQ